MIREHSHDPDEFGAAPTWQYERKNGSTAPLLSVAWSGLEPEEIDGWRGYSIVIAAGSTLLHSRGRFHRSSWTLMPETSYAEEFATLTEAYEAAIEMIFIERGPNETQYIHNSIEGESLDHRRLFFNARVQMRMLLAEASQGGD